MPFFMIHPLERTTDKLGMETIANYGEFYWNDDDEKYKAALVVKMKMYFERFEIGYMINLPESRDGKISIDSVSEWYKTNSKVNMLKEKMIEKLLNLREDNDEKR